MEVRPGYKQTEIGVIPEDWEVRRLGELAKVHDGTHQTPKYVPDGIPFYSVEHITSGDFTNTKFISNEEHRFLTRSYRIERGDVLMTRIGSIGDCRLVDWEVNASFYVSLALLKVHYADAAFVTQYSKSRAFKAEAELHSLPSATPKKINLGPISDIRLPVPLLPEQRAIAAALSDVDALLGGLNRLIAKKRDLKQAAMQQLLTGQTRLPGFSAAWEVKRLGEIGEISSAGVDKKLRREEVPVRLVNYLDVYHKDFIYSRDLNHWVTAPTHQLRRCAVKKGDVFFTPTSETRNDIGLSAVAMEDIPDAAYSYHVARLRLHEPWDLRFRTYAFKTRAFLDQAETLCDGNGTRYVISQGKFRSMMVSVPPIAEQAAIAAVLSDMDAELATLGACRDKTRDLKQAMMQELLTGKTRLVKPEAAHA